MPFQPGNQEAKKGNHAKRRIVTQQLISALNEADASNVKTVRRVVNALIKEAEDGDVQAIKEIFDRVEGKAPQPVTGEAGEGPMKLVVEWAKSSGS